MLSKPKPTKYNHFVTLSNKPPIQIIAINSLLDERKNRQCLESLQKRLTIEDSSLIIDLSHLAIINGIGINFLLQVLAHIKPLGGQLYLTNVSTKVLQILSITKLTSIFIIKNSIEEALTSLRKECEKVC